VAAVGRRHGHAITTCSPRWHGWRRSVGCERSENDGARCQGTSSLQGHPVSPPEVLLLPYGDRCLSVCRCLRQASNASTRCAAETAISTPRLPILERPHPIAAGDALHPGKRSCNSVADLAHLRLGQWGCAPVLQILTGPPSRFVRYHDREEDDRRIQSGPRRRPPRGRQWARHAPDSGRRRRNRSRADKQTELVAGAAMLGRDVIVPNAKQPCDTDGRPRVDDDARRPPPRPGATPTRAIVREESILEPLRAGGLAVGRRNEPDTRTAVLRVVEAVGLSRSRSWIQWDVTRIRRQMLLSTRVDLASR